MALGAALCLCPSEGFAREQASIRVGYLSNITHAPVLVGLARGDFQRAMSTGTSIDLNAFNAGPAVIEAMLAGAIDVGYVGPTPAINGHVRSEGALQIVAGACSGGAFLIIHGSAPIRAPEDFRGRTLATPQIGNTQDVAARRYLLERGMNTLERGGEVRILPIANADQLTLFKRGQLDAAWAPEPWASRLVLEGGGRVFLDERTRWPGGQFSSTVIVVRRDFLNAHPDRVERWLRTHLRTMAWMRRHPREARDLAASEIKRLTGKALPAEVTALAWTSLEFTADPLRASLFEMAEGSRQLGFLGRRVLNLDRLLDTRILDALSATERIQ